MKTFKSLFPTVTMPVLFIGHGSPMNAVEDNQFTQAWQDVIANITKPQVIIVMSAHWQTNNGTYLTAQAQPPTIYDIYGFPEALYNLQYSAPGLPKLVEELTENIRGLQPSEEWGFDHGTWSILQKMYPQADIPVIQMSIDASLSIVEQVTFIKKLQFLRQWGVLFIGSGNIVHNLQLLNWNSNQSYLWAANFDQKVKELIEKNDLNALMDYQNLTPDSHYCIPSDEHYRPMLAALALRTNQDKVHFFAEEIVMGSIAMRSFILRDV